MVELDGFWFFWSAVVDPWWFPYFVIKTFERLPIDLCYNKGLLSLSSNSFLIVFDSNLETSLANFESVFYPIVLDWTAAANGDIMLAVGYSGRGPVGDVYPRPKLKAFWLIILLARKEFWTLTLRLLISAFRVGLWTRIPVLFISDRVSLTSTM